MKKLNQIVILAFVVIFYNSSVTPTQAITQLYSSSPSILLAQGKGNESDLQNPTQPLTSQTLDDLNPLKNNSDVADQLSTPGGIITRLLTFAFPLAGIILFVMLTWSGFEIVAGAASKKSQDAGKQRATAAVVGFLLLFASYWIIQVIEVIFNVAILG